MPPESSPVVTTFVILGLFLTGKKGTNDDGDATLSVGKGRGWMFGSLYFFWTIFIIGRAMEWPWLESLVG